MEPIEQPRQEPGGLETAAELRLLRTLIKEYDRSPPSQADVDNALESGVARLMSLEAQRRAQASRESKTRASEECCEDRELVKEISALQEAVAELRTRANLGESAPLAHGFVLRRKP